MRKRTIQLPPSQQKELKIRLRKAKSVAEYRRLVVLRLSDKGLHIREVARTLGTSAETVREDLNRFESGGFESLVAGERGGSSPKLPEKNLESLEKVLVTPPLELGYLANQWTLNLMRRWLIENRGIEEIDISTLSRRMRARGWRRLAPRLAIIRKDPARKVKLAAIEAEKKGFWRKTLKV